MLQIIHGKVMTMTGVIYEDGLVEIENGKITGITEYRSEHLSSPDSKKKNNTDNNAGNSKKNDNIVINAEGCWVMPGLIEAHCHMGITEEKKGIEGDDCNESVHPITPMLRAIDAINPMDAAFDDAVRAGITSAMIGPGSANVVGGQFAFVKTKGRSMDDLIVLAPAAMKVAFGENPKVNYSGMGQSPATRMAIAGMLRRELWEAKQYQSQKKKAAKNKENFTESFHWESWLPVLEHRIPLKAHVHRADDIFTAIRIAKEFDLDMTLDHCSEGHLIAEEIAESGFPAILGPDFASRNKIEVQNMAFKTAGILHQAGVKTAITTDHPVSIIQSLPLCAGMAVKAVLPMEEGLKSITIYPAQICRVDDRVGSLGVGKDGDIAIFDGNPMELFTHNLCTVINGQIQYKADDFSARVCYN
ncbi:MAG: amidohydrolase [Lachnospiraceae bacterium]|nr:amidohydrolase [Lachnospiraceae bacterium]